MRHKQFFCLLALISLFVFNGNTLLAGESSTANSGKIIGKITYTGAVKTRKKLDITKDVKICGKVEHFEESLLVSKDKGIANVVVSLTGVDGGKSLDSWGTDFSLDQNGCQFIPHVLLLPVGTKVKIKNSDGILHNIHTFSEDNEAINKAQPRFLKVLSASFDEPEVVRVVCDVHNWMGCYIAVVEHPYHAITDENGNYELTDIPAGTYTLETWHETLGEKSLEVTIKDDGTLKQNIELATP